MQSSDVSPDVDANSQENQNPTMVFVSLGLLSSGSLHPERHLMLIRKPIKKKNNINLFIKESTHAHTKKKRANVGLDGYSYSGNIY